jgi:predicted transposase YbfD/YdcC
MPEEEASMFLGDRPRLRVLLDHFAALADDRESWRVAHPLPEVLLLVVCGTIGSCDDFDEIVAWGKDNLPFLRRFLPYHHGVPGSRWLRALLNRIDPGLFSQMFQSWAAELRPDAPALVAIDGKSSRGSRDATHARAALHLVSAFATREKLVLAQEAVAEGGNEQTTIPLLLERLAAKGQLRGALVSIDAVACNAGAAQAILDAGADYLLAVKANQPGLMGEIALFFDDPAAQDAITTTRDADKGHGRVEERVVGVSTRVDWLDVGRRFPGEHRFPKLALIARVAAATWEKNRKTSAVRYYVSSRAMTPQALAEAVRSHWAIENSLHWVLDVTFREDAARSRTGHGPANMAVARHFAFNMLKAVTDKRSLKLRRNRAARNPAYMAQIIGQIR